MDHDTLSHLKQSHATLRLLNAENMPLIIGFLHSAFIRPNHRSLPFSDVQSRLEDYLYQIRDLHGDEFYPRSAKAYLEDWASGESAYLRKYYTDETDEPFLDPTPAAEKAMEWLESLKAREFVGTESRLRAIFELLRDIVHQTETDAEARIRALEERKEEIDREIEAVRARGLPPGDPTRVKERFFHAEDTARKLLADFRQVEYNFRQLDRETRERIAISDKPKGELLDEIFHDQDVIRDSDQGKSFRAFWEFLMSRSSQTELRELLDIIFSLEEIQGLSPDRFLMDIPRYLLDAGERVHQTGNLLVAQLRKYLDDQAWLENRRIMGLIRAIEKKAITLKEEAPSGKEFIRMDSIKPDFDFTMASPLFSPPKVPVIQATELRAGDADIDLDALYRQHHIDMAELTRRIRMALQSAGQISLAGLVETYPIQKGLAELLAYLHLAHKDSKAFIHEEETDMIPVTTEAGIRKQVRTPRVIFTR